MEPCGPACVNGHRPRFHLSLRGYMIRLLMRDRSHNRHYEKLSICNFCCPGNIIGTCHQLEFNVDTVFLLVLRVSGSAHSQALKLPLVSGSAFLKAPLLSIDKRFCPRLPHPCLLRHASLFPDVALAWRRSTYYFTPSVL